MSNKKETSFSEKVRNELRSVGFTSTEKEYSIIENEVSEDDSRTQTEMVLDRINLARLFLEKGSVTDPAKAYHMEFVCDDGAQADAVRQLLAKYEISAGVTGRGVRSVVYIKDGEDVSAVLRLMGASKCLMEMENTRIVREMRGDVNRRVNFDSANIDRTVTASALQTTAIQYLMDTGELKTLPKSLRAVAELRMKMPEATLTQLAEAMKEPIGKSGINHRLQKIVAHYNALLNEELPRKS